MTKFVLKAALLASVAFAAPAYAQHEHRTELFKPGVDHAGPALIGAAAAPVGNDGLGDYGWRLEGASREAQVWFTRGLGHLWGFNHTAAVAAFRKAQQEDGTCALCFWGEAYALGPNLNDGMHADNEAAALGAALAAAERARTPREKALAQAILKRTEPGVEQSARNEAFAAQMDEIVARFVGDANLLAIRADALMNLQPWDYWQSDGRTPKGNTAEILATLEHAMEIAPSHPAALHLYIHAVEASADPSRGLEAADRLRALSLNAGHLVHMPAHIYNRTGRFADSIAVNKAAVAADEAYLEAAGEAASPLYRYGYYPHNVHFLLVAAQMAGLEEEAIGTAQKLAAVTSEEVSSELAWVEAIMTAPLTAHAQFSDLETILALPRPSDDFPFVVGHWHYARGVALALAGETEAAHEEKLAIDRLIEEADFSALEAQALPARTVLTIAKLVVAARVAQALGDGDAAVDVLKEAVSLQDKIAYMEPSYWYYPVRQTLGAVELLRGNTPAALSAFDGALEETPNNAFALWGLWQALKKDHKDQGDEGQIAEARRAFERAFLGDPSILALDRL